MTKQSENGPDFESSLKELETLVEQLESGDLNLAQSLEHFKRGISLSKQCHRMIDEARQTVTLLVDPDDESSAIDFNEESDEKSG